MAGNAGCLQIFREVLQVNSARREDRSGAQSKGLGGTQQENSIPQRSKADVALVRGVLRRAGGFGVLKFSRDDTVRLVRPQWETAEELCRVLPL